MPSGNSIQFEFDAVLLENCYKSNPENRIAKRYGYRNVCKIPKCRDREILAWGQISAGDQKGFNLLLLKNEKDIYGEWWTMTNTNSGFGPRKRSEPFGFRLIELPEEIQLITATHIYSSDLKELDMEHVLQFITQYV